MSSSSFLMLSLFLLIINICSSVIVPKIGSLSDHDRSVVVNALASEWNTRSVAEHEGVIVMHAKQTGHINGWLLVVNGEDLAATSLSELLQMYVDTFGREMAQQLGVVITRSYLIPDNMVAAFRQELDAILTTLTGRPVKDTPVWLVETNMDRLKARGIPDSVVQEANNHLTVVDREIKQWLTRQAPRQVATVVPAPHLRCRKEFEAEEKLRVAIESFDKESLKAEQQARKDLLRAAEAIRVFAGQLANARQEMAQFIDAHAGNRTVSWFERYGIFKTLPLAAANVDKSIDNLPKDSISKTSSQSQREREHHRQLSERRLLKANANKSIDNYLDVEKSGVYIALV